MTVTEEEEVRCLLNAIVSLGGILSDYQYTFKSGPNDSVARGLKFVEARRLANEALRIMNRKYDVMEKDNNG